MIKIVDKEQCCGCSACLHICPKNSITFKEDEEGFLYPHVNMETCIDCGLCEKVCPVLNKNSERLPLKVFAAKHPNEEIRMSSSSGGIFTMLAEQIIDEGGVVFGAKFNESWEVVHDFAETKDKLLPFRGSKYVQSKIGESYAIAENFLKSGRKVMFTGTPCQIAGLKKYLRREYNNLFTVDLICHGVPSPIVWRKYLEEEIARQGGIGRNTISPSSRDIPVLSNVNFRDKTLSWKKYSFVLRFKKSSVVEEHNVVLSSIFYKNPYMKAFLSNLSLRPSCYNCPAKSGRSGADITIGDFWGVEDVLLDKDDKGVSLLLIHNNSILDNVKTDLINAKYEDVVKYNVCICRSVSKPVNRSYFFSNLKRRGFFYAYNDSTNDRIYYRLKRRLLRTILK